MRQIASVISVLAWRLMASELSSPDIMPLAMVQDPEDEYRRREAEAKDLEEFRGGTFVQSLIDLLWSIIKFLLSIGYVDVIDFGKKKVKVVGVQFPPKQVP